MHTRWHVIMHTALHVDDTAAKRGTSDETEATDQRAHNQRIMLKAADCDGLRHVVQFPVGGDVDAHHTASLTLTPHCAALPSKYYR